MDVAFIVAKKCFHFVITVQGISRLSLLQFKSADLVKCRNSYLPLAFLLVGPHISFITVIYLFILLLLRAATGRSFTHGFMSIFAASSSRKWIIDELWG